MTRHLDALTKNQRLGLLGEEAAAHFLTQNGFRITARNYVVGKDEIDIIAENRELYIFCEVKSRVQEYGKPSKFGRPASAVTAEKQKNIIHAAAAFAARHKNKGKRFRFDVIEVYFSAEEQVSHIHHIQGAFSR